jgi:hypothetical protein
MEGGLLGNGLGNDLPAPLLRSNPKAVRLNLNPTSCKRNQSPPECFGPSRSPLVNSTALKVAV